MATLGNITFYADDPRALAKRVKLVTGVVDHGLFIDMADLAMTVDEAGRVTTHERTGR